MSRDLVAALVLALLLHGALFYYRRPLTSEVKYDIVRTTSAVEVSIVRTVKKKVPVIEEKPEVKKVEKKPKKIKKKPVVKKKSMKKAIRKPVEPRNRPESVKETAQKVVTPVEKKPAPKTEKRPAPKITSEAAPDYLRNKPPEYPPIARRMGYEGVVYLRVEVTAEGSPNRVEIKRSSGYSILDDSAYKAVMKWKFKPAERGDKPVRSWVVVPVRFTLRGG